MTCPPSDHMTKTHEQFQKDWHKTVGVWTQGTHYLYTLIVSKPDKMTIKVQNMKKSDKNSDHDKNICTFSKDQHKTVRGVTDTRYMLSEGAELCSMPHAPRTMESRIPCPLAFQQKGGQQ